MATFLGMIALLLWGGLALLGATTVNIPAFQLLSLCFFISALIMPVKRFLQGKVCLMKPTLTRSQWLIGIVGLFGFHFCYFMALKAAPAIEVSLIVYSWPLLLTLFVSTRKTRLSALVGGFLGFIGIAFIVLGNHAITMSTDYIIGYSLAVCCSLIWSCYSWFLTQSTSRVDDVGWLSLAVALLALISHYCFEYDYVMNADSLQSSVIGSSAFWHAWNFSVIQWIGIMLLGLGPVGGAFYLWDIALKQGNGALLASLSFSTPLISSVVLSIAGLNPWTMNVVIALILIVLGAIVANKNLLKH